MDSHFRDNINLPNSHPSVLGHCYLFLVKNRVFGLLDRIAPKRATWSDCSETSPENQKKKFKDRGSLRRYFLWDSVPQNPKFHRLDPFFIFSEKSEKICISFIWFLEFFGAIFIFLWFYLTGFQHFLLNFFVVFKKQNSKLLKCERVWWLIYIRIVRIIKSEIVNMNPDFKIRNAQGHFWKFYKRGRRS